MATFFIQDVYKITGIGVIPVGRVDDGPLRMGMKTNLNGKILEISSIESNHKQIKEANPGSNVGINLRLVNPTNMNFFKKIFSGSSEEYNILKGYKGKRVEFI